MYTNVLQRGNYLYVRGIENGRKFATKVDFRPTIWVQGKLADATDKWQTLDGQDVYAMQPGTMYDCKQFIDKYKDVHGFAIYESPGHAYQYIAETYRDEIVWNRDDLTVFTIDIETETEYGFPEPATAGERILLITIKDTRHNNIVTFGLHPFVNDMANVEYRHSADESDLLKDFIVWWQQNYPDIVTGWNSSLFDLTYLYNRMCRVLGESVANKFSPWGHVRQREIDFGGRKALKTYLGGIASLDYLDLYKKFTYSAQESYKLDYIAQIELGERKLENPGSTFKEYYQNHWQTFVKYNIRDVELVDRLDDKMKLIDLALTIAYAAKVNYEDVFGPLKTWDVIIYNYLNDRRIVIPPRKGEVKEQAFEGAYVKDPLVGKHNWCVSFDLNSLYPHLIMQYNMSPETITDKRFDVSVDKLLEKACDLSSLTDLDYTMAANGWCFKKDVRGLLPIQMERYYNLRLTYKKKMIEAKQQYQKTKDDKYLKDISRYTNLQMAMKILINSAYGVCGNVAFRYYDRRIAEGITISGQLSIRWIANKLNEFFNKTLKTNDVDRVVLIDTDSVVLTLDDLITNVCPDKSTADKIKYMDKIAEDIVQPFIDKSYEDLADYMNAYEQKMQMKRENLVDTMISVSKKRYVMSVYNSEGVQYDEPQLKVMGLQVIKSSTPAVIRAKLRDSLKAILYGSERDVQKYIDDYRTEFNKLAPEQIAFPRSISDVSKYRNTTSIYTKGTPIHVRGALLYNHHVKKNGLSSKYQSIQEGDKIKFLYLKVPNPIREDCIAFLDKLPAEFELTSYIDYRKMFEKTFEDAVENIIEPLGWSTKPKATLEDWFS